MNRAAAVVTVLSAIVLLAVCVGCFPRRMNELTAWTFFGIPMWMASMALCAGQIGVTLLLLVRPRGAGLVPGR